MTTARPRIDLDGVTLSDPARDGAALAVFRRRTTAGLVLLIPESADLTVPWEDVEAAEVDLVAGRLVVRFAPAYAARHNWLRGARELVGEWTDRVVIG